MRCRNPCKATGIAARMTAGAVLGLVCLTGSPAHADAPLTVRVNGLSDTRGRGHFSLYDSASAFDARKPTLTATLSVTNGACTWSLPELPAGRYSIQFYHDTNDNGALDRNTLGIPREPVAFSNNARPRFGPPRYEMTSFAHAKEPSEQSLRAFTTLGRRGRLGLGVAAIANQSPYDSGDARVIAIPMITYIGDRLMVAGPRVSYQCFGSPRVRVAAAIEYSFDGFDTDDADMLEGMHERGDTVMGGALVAFEPVQDWELQGRLSADLLGEHGGARGSLRVSREHRIRDVQVQLGLGMEWLDAKMADHYYGVRAAEATSVRPAYVADDAFSPTVTLSARYTVTEALGLLSNIEWTWLGHEIRDSPIVVRDGVASVFVALAYAL